jgi:LEA14-like dessication related protein
MIPQIGREAEFRMNSHCRAPLAVVIAAAAALVGIPGCATMPDPLDVTVAGIEPLQGEGMEIRMLVKLRVQNPNDGEVVYTGSSVKLEVLDKTFATGVSDASGTVPRFGEAIVEVPVTVSVLRMVRQVIGMLDGKPIDKVQYEMSGKLQTGTFSAVRFGTSGELEIPKGSPASP